MKNKFFLKITSSALAAIVALSTLLSCAGGNVSTSTAGKKTSAKPIETTLPITTLAPPITLPRTEPIKANYPTVGGKENLLDLTGGMELTDSRPDANIDYAACDGELLVCSSVRYEVLDDEEWEYSFERQVFTVDLASGREIARIDFNYDSCAIKFLSDGKILLFSEPMYAAVVDRELNILVDYESSIFTDTMSADPYGRVWECCSGKYIMSCRDLLGGSSQNYLISGFEYGFYIATVDGISYFRMMDSRYDSHTIALDEKSGEIREVELSDDVYPDSSMGTLVVAERGNYYNVTDITSPEKTVKFPMEHGYEYTVSAEGNRLTTVGFKSDDYEGGMLTVYDVTSGDVLCILDSEALGFSSIGVASMGGSGDILLIAWQGDDDGEESARLLLWRTAEEPLYKKCTDFVEVGGQISEGAVAESAARIKNRFGIIIKYSESSLYGAFSDYELYPTDDEATLKEGIEVLERALAEYPDEFFDEVCEGGGFSRLVIYLCGGFRPLTDHGIDSAAALTSTDGGSIIMAFDVRISSVLRQNLAHEMMHAMEHRISSYLTGLDTSIGDIWSTLNPRGFDYYYSYHEKDGSEISNQKYTAWDQPSTAFFIDPYSKSFPSEDRARIFEHLFEGDDELFESPYLVEKAKKLTAIIREAFPSVAAEDELLWEEILRDK